MNPKDSQDVPEEFLRALERADGYIDLEMPDGAQKELDAIPDSHRAGGVYRKVFLRLLLLKQDWAAAAALAQQLCDEDPGEAGLWIHLAYARRRAIGLDDAYAILKSAFRRFPKEAVIPFNLACYECQLGRSDAALKHLQRAFALDPGFRLMAAEDEDLKPLWDRLDE
jgi:tetratricopeptide (TPR) repeat protein